jgi:hypothetical protein
MTQTGGTMALGLQSSVDSLARAAAKLDRKGLDLIVTDHINGRRPDGGLKIVDARPILDQFVGSI